MKQFLRDLKVFYKLFTPKERRKLAVVLLGMLVTGIFEVAGVGSVVPFLAVAGNPSMVTTNPMISPVYHWLGFTRPQDFVLFLGLAVIAFLFISNAVKATVFYFTVRFTKLRMADMTSRLFRHFLFQPYYFFLNRNSSEILKNVFEDLPQTLDGILDPLLDLFSKVIIVLGLIILVMFTDPFMALGVSLVFGIAYLILFGLIRKPLSHKGHYSNELGAERYRNVTEALGGVKEVKFVGTEAQYLKRYEVIAKAMCLNDASRDILSAFPKYFLEVLAFGGIIGIVLIYLAQGRNLTQILPVLGLYAFAGYRLMPYLQQIFADMAKIRFTATRLRVTVEVFSSGEAAQEPREETGRAVVFKNCLELRSVRFRYPRSEKLVLDGLDLQIPVRSTVGLVGFSGAGKSTLVDLLLGLLDLPPDSVFIDGTPLGPDNIRAWKAKIGYVPQQIYLSDNTISRNIAFGIPEKDVDQSRVERAAKMAKLHDFITAELPLGYQTMTGERGVRLSGGQRQRIGIARALYRNPEVLILDEATSALDGVTEAAIMEAIHHLGHSMTIIIIAHRLTTLKECDEIFVLEAGQVTDKGTYQGLLERNAQFRDMAGRKKAD